MKIAEQKNVSRMIKSQSVCKVINYIDLCCGRIFSFYHYKQDESYLFSSVRKKINQSKDGNIYVENANNIRDFLKAEDVVKIIYKLFRKKWTG